MTIMANLLRAISAHLAGFELAPPWSVSITPSQPDRDIQVQLECVEPAETATTLLAWADTLTEVTAEAWRCYDGHRLHLSITGKLSTGATVRVYDAIPYTGHGIGADLASGAATSLRPGVLRALARSEEHTSELQSPS